MAYVHFLVTLPSIIKAARKHKRAHVYTHTHTYKKKIKKLPVGIVDEYILF